MKQLEVMNFASLTEKWSKIQHKVVSQNQRKYMAQKLERRFALVYERNFNFFQYLPLVNGRKP